MSLDSSVKTDSINSESDSEDFTGEVFFESQLSTIGNRLIGCPVILRNKLNETYHGTLVTFTSDFDVILESCHQVVNTSHKKIEHLHSRIFERDQIVEVVARDVEDDFSHKSAESSFNESSPVRENQLQSGMSKLTLSSSSSGSTSLSTSSTSDYCGSEASCRELEPYVFEDGKEDDLFYSLSETTSDKKEQAETVKSVVSSSSSLSNGGWKVEDMLQVNKSKYGYKSTFNSEMTEYTLPLIKQNTAEFRRREAEAERLAREIESDLNYRANVDKELSDGEDEEMAFSAVHRPTADKKHKYTPGSAKSQNKTPKSSSSTQRQRITSSATTSSNRQRNPRRVK